MLNKLYKTPDFIREPEETYHARSAECMTSHQLSDFRRCPLLHKKKASGLIPRYESQAYVIGSATHCLVLEGEAEFARRYVVGGPVNPKTERPYGTATKKFRDWAKQQTRTVISDDQYALAVQMAMAVKRHDEARGILMCGSAEGVLRLKHQPTDVLCQISCDWFNPRYGLVDLKTCGSIDDFEEDAAKYQYVHQLAFYRSVIQQATGEFVDCRLIAVEKQEPYRCCVWDIDGNSLHEAHRQNMQALADYAECRKADIWPTLTEAIRTLRLAL